MDFGLIVNLISGAVGGVLGGKVLKGLSLGTVGNALVGILGGGVGGQILAQLGIGGADAAEAANAFDPSAIIQSLGGGGVGGVVLLAVVGVLKRVFGK